MEPLVVDWSPHYTCNFKCHYCWYDPCWEDNLKLNRYGVHHTLVVQRFREMFERYGESKIQIAGGEPTRYPHFLDIVLPVSRWHRLWICSNLSQTDGFFERLLAGVPADRLGFTGSYHPQFMPLGRFVERAAAIRGAGMGLEVVCVAWPPLLAGMEEAFDALRGAGIDRVRLQPFNGLYQDLRYPEAYTPDQRRLIARLNREQGDFVRTQTDYLLHDRTSAGRLCSSGQKYIHIQADGNVYRCNLDQRRSLGNFFDGTYRLFDKPEFCDIRHCNCEWCWIVDEKPARSMDRLTA